MMKPIIKFLTIALCLAVATLYGCKKDYSSDFEFEDNYIAIVDELNGSYRECISPKDAVVYPEPWTQEVAATFTIPQATIENMSTCGLIQTFLNHPSAILGPWCNYCSGGDGIIYFNSIITLNPVPVELLTRDDAFDLLLLRYINMMEELLKENDPEKVSTWLADNIAMILASDNMRLSLTKQQAEKLLVVSLKISETFEKKWGYFLNANTHIMLSALISLQYEAFLNDPCFASGSLKTDLWGYIICREDPGLIVKYVRDYLNANL
ncbi:MAG: hypothetical protein GX660_04480 [Clostridiaceae bacterium]|nr:hypothetical protein [Clostridiaceae bacterium]